MLCCAVLPSAAVDWIRRLCSVYAGTMLKGKSQLFTKFDIL